MHPLPELRIIIPACNEADRIEPTIRRYCMQFSSTGVILVVANGCTDGTPDVVRLLQSEYANREMIEIAGRIGKGGAVRAGLWTGAEPYVGFVDADGSTDAEEFARLFARIRSSEVDGVIGSRWLTGARVEPRQPLGRRLASRAFNAIVRTLFRLPFVDTQCGAKIFTRRAIAKIAHSLEVANFAFDIEVLWRLHLSRFRVLEIPTVWADRQHGTKIRLAASSWSMLKSVLRLRLRNSWLWLLPFVDRFAHANVIPVVGRHRMLVLGGRIEELRKSEQMSRFFDALETVGFTLSDAIAEPYAGGSSSVLQRLKQLLWYAFSSHREYDGILEICAPALAWIPYFSVKPSFVISDESYLLLPRHRSAYQRASFIDLTTISAANAAATVLVVQSGEALYNAVFYSSQGEVALHCPTTTGRREYHVLHS